MSRKNSVSKKEIIEADEEMSSDHEDNNAAVAPVTQLKINRGKDIDLVNQPYSATYAFYDEDHTLGNCLRNQIVKNKYVEFCAYSVPHPSEPIVNVRI